MHCTSSNSCWNGASLCVCVCVWYSLGCDCHTSFLWAIGNCRGDGLVSWGDPQHCNLTELAGRTAHLAEDQCIDVRHRCKFMQLGKQLRDQNVGLPVESSPFLHPQAPDTPPFCVLQSIYFLHSLLHDFCIHQLVNVARIWIGKAATKTIDCFLYKQVTGSCL